jgi:hypothetical protein
MTKVTVEKLYKQIKWYRISLVVVFSLVVVIITILNVRGRINYLGNNYSLLDPARVFVGQESYIINIQDLRTYLQELGDRYPNSISMYYEQINSGSNISINKDLRLYPASLSKLAQAIIIVKKVEEGELSWNQKLKTEKSDLSERVWQSCTKQLGINH